MIRTCVICVTVLKSNVLRFWIFNQAFILLVASAGRGGEGRRGEERGGEGWEGEGRGGEDLPFLYTVCMPLFGISNFP